ncbi:recombinase family protein [Luteibacter sahnii]|uniref:recombinase family protein n=1 Tax=Luteibacter sahnii TaxID=3021977 RepID=UPI002A69A1D8|nr:recombinase family protein [Luteibacter sp. PPL193]MDY1549569.1 recombinase family protein [Luteibacter sp. PPL193]
MRSPESTEPTGLQDAGTRVIPAAAYLRVSTDMQEGSIAEQAEAIEAYAQQRGMLVVRTFCDAGISGLTADRRPGLQSLLRTIGGGSPGFDAVLVFDVSRWGRFQNTDEAAYHEFLCWKAGIQVFYVAEHFTNDLSPFSMVVKGLKRVMAAEYSRELSAKVRAGQRRLAGMGYRQGGLPGYGLRRMLLDPDGTPKGLLAHGQHKGLTTDRVVLVPGPPDEVAVVRRIFEMYAKDPQLTRIVEVLNREGIPAVGGVAWKIGRVTRILGSEKYVGTAVYGKRTQYLGGPEADNPVEDWVRKREAYAPVVCRELFDAVQAQRKARRHVKTNSQVLDSLRELLIKEGRLSLGVINAAPGVMSGPQVIVQFGSLMEAYRRLGYTPTRSAYSTGCRLLARWRISLTGFLRDHLRALGHRVTQKGWCLRINDAWSVSFIVLLEKMNGSGQAWLNVRQYPDADMVVLARLPRKADVPCDYLILPTHLFPMFPAAIASRRDHLLDNFRFRSLSLLEDLAQLSGRREGCLHHERCFDGAGEAPHPLVLDAAAKAEHRFQRVGQTMARLTASRSGARSTAHHGLTHLGKARSSRLAMNHRAEGRQALEGVVLAGALQALLAEPETIRWLSRYFPRERAAFHEASVLSLGHTSSFSRR